jgi:hypothetical protein
VPPIPQDPRVHDKGHKRTYSCGGEWLLDVVVMLLRWRVPWGVRGGLVRQEVVHPQKPIGIWCRLRLPLEDFSMIHLSRFCWPLG